MAFEQALKLKRVRLLARTSATILLAAAFGAVAGGQPQIVVQFEVKSASVRRGLADAAEIEKLQQSLSTYLAERIRQQLGFAAWNATEDANRPVLGRLIARLDDEPDAEIPAIRVEWFSKRGTGPETPLGWAFTTIVERNDVTAELGNRAAVEQLTRGKLDAIPGVDFKKNLLETFMTRIPLATSVTANDVDRLVELPMQRDELPLGLRSVMAVEFSRTTPVAKEGQIRLTRFGHTGSGRLRASVDDVVVNSKALALTDNWNPELPNLFVGATVECFLRDYEPEGLVTTSVVTVPR